MPGWPAKHPATEHLSASRPIDMGASPNDKTDDPDRTQRLPYLQRVVDEFLTNWPTDTNDQPSDPKDGDR